MDYKLVGGHCTIMAMMRYVQGSVKQTIKEGTKKIVVCREKEVETRNNPLDDDEEREDRKQDTKRVRAD